MAQNLDEDLMRLYLQGDATAFNELYKRHSGKVYAYLLKRTRNSEEANDLHQAVFLKFHNSRHKYDPKYAVLQWLFVISKTTLIDFFRKNGRKIIEVSDLTEEEIYQSASIQNKNIEPLSQTEALSALDGLEPLQRKAVEWRVLDEASYSEIAKKLGSSEQNARQIVSRALKRLREASQMEGSKK